MKTIFKKMHLIGAIAMMLLFAPLLKAQSLRIEYDFIKDKVTFYKLKPGDDVGKVISSPVVGRNKMVVVEVVNFNNFVYTAQATYESQKINEQTDMSFMNIITPLVVPGATGSFFTSMGGELPDDISRGGLLSTRDASDAYDDLRNAYATMADIEGNITTMEYAIKKLNKIRYNPYLPTDTIEKIADHLIQVIFKKSAVNPSDFTDAIVAFNSQLTEAKSNFNNASNRFLNAYNEYASLSETPEFEGSGLDQTVRSFKTQINSAASQIDPEYIAARIDMLESIYTSIKTTSFSFNSSHAAKDDQVDLELTFYKNPAMSDSSGPGLADMSNLDALSKVKDKKIRIVVRGDMKINTSIGLGFPRFETNSEFINKDSVITTQNGSSFSPNLAGYINFYPYTGRVLNIGGTFGIGVPLTDKSRTVNMLMGAVGMFGSENRVAVHLGASLGQVKVLGEGFSAGDKLLSSTQEVPLRNNWEWGGFVGISFNIAKNSGS